MLKVKLYRLLTSVFLFCFIFSNSSFAAVSIEWDAASTNTNNSQLNDFSHYLVKVGLASSTGFLSTTSTSGNSLTISSLATGDYRVVVVTVDTDNNESTASSELRFSIAESRLDSDSDRLSDKEEEELGTDINSADSDGDSVSDKQEVDDNTDPNDRGNHLPVHELKICAPWNGYLIDTRGRGMWNVYEHLNTTTSNLNIFTQVLDPRGTSKEDYSFVLPSSVQRDILIHDFESREENSYGNVCSQSSGSPGDLRGTMVYYKPSSTTEGYDFALAIPAISAKKGRQYLPLNTYNPSLASQDQSNVLSSWAQITNENTTTESGTLRYWKSDGTLLKDARITMEPSSRVDLAMHDVGPQTLGFVEWVPDSSEAKFKLDSTRYFYDNPWSVNSFEGAAYLPGFVPTGSLIGAPFDTRNSSAILELSNVKDVGENVSVKAYSEDGSNLIDMNVFLAPKSTYHVILDWYFTDVRGLVTAQSGSRNSIFANLMQYKRRTDGGFYFLHAIPAIAPIGQNLTGSYNTYISHNAELMIANFDSSVNPVTVNMTRLSGEKIINNESMNVPASGLYVINLNEREAADNYGVVNVTGGAGKRVAAWVSRERELEYNLTLQLTQ